MYMCGLQQYLGNTRVLEQHPIWSAVGSAYSTYCSGRHGGGTDEAWLATQNCHSRYSIITTYFLLGVPNGTPPAALATAACHPMISRSGRMGPSRRDRGGEQLLSPNSKRYFNLGPRALASLHQVANDVTSLQHPYYYCSNRRGSFGAVSCEFYGDFPCI